MTDTVKHAVYGASSFYRWRRCAGSIKMTAARPPMPPSWYADEGTYAHALLSHILAEGETDALAYESLPYMGGGELRGVYSKDDVLAVQTAVDAFYEIVNAHPGCEWHLEKTLPFPTDTGEDAFGTCDLLIYCRDTKTLYVPDYKHGVRYVDHRDNPQTLYYATSAVFAHPEWDVDIAIPGIIQPRALGAGEDIAVRWDTPKTIADLLAFIDEVDTAIRASLELAPKLSASIEACRYCPGSYYKICPEAERASLQVVRQTFSTYKDVTQASLPKAQDIPIERLSYILTFAPMLIDWLKRAEEYALELETTGKAHIPGFKLVLPNRRRKFLEDVDGVASELALISGLPVQSFIKRGLIGVTEAETILKTSARENAGRTKAAKKAAVDTVVELMAFLTDKVQPQGISLVPESDPRPAHSPAAVNFAGVKQIE